MKRVGFRRAVCLSVITALGLAGVGASAAQAEFWVGKEGSFLLATLAGSQIGLIGKFLVPSRGFTINCQVDVITSGEIEEPGGGQIKGNSEQCTFLNYNKEQLGKAEELASCSLAEPVASEAKLLPLGSGATKYIRAEPVEEGGLFTTKKIEGAACSIKGTYPIKGTISAKFITNGEPVNELESSRTFSESIGDSLTLGIHPAWIDAKVTIELGGIHSGVKFGVA